MLQHPPSSTLFPYTTLFRSQMEIRPINTEADYRGEMELLWDVDPETSDGDYLDALSTLTEALRGKALPDLRLRSEDRKSTRLNSSHVEISYAVFCLKKKKNT